MDDRRIPPTDRALLTSVPGGLDRLRSVVPLLNAAPFPPGVHHDVPEPIPVSVTLRWADGPSRELVEQRDTFALEWCRGVDGDPVVRVRLTDPRSLTGAAWLPAADVRRTVVANETGAA